MIDVRTLLLIGGLMLAATCAACGPGARSQTSPPPTRPASQHAARAKRVHVIPWIEVNLGKREEIEKAVKGLRIWQKVTDTAIVSTTVGRSRIYTRLRERVPGMHIIPGIKTAGYCSPFDSVSGWRTIADEVSSMCRATGEQRIVLENETALCSKRLAGRNDYWSAKVKLDFDELRRGLRMLPEGVEIWWYPSFVTGKSQRALRHEQSAKLCRLVEDVCDVRFIDYEVSKPPDRNVWWNDDLSRIRKQIAQRPSIPIIYLYGDDTRYWPDERILEALARVPGEDAILYPGRRWVEAAERIATILINAKMVEEH